MKTVFAMKVHNFKSTDDDDNNDNNIDNDDEFVYENCPKTFF